MHHLPDLFQGFEPAVDIRLRVVEVEARAACGILPEILHQGLGAVMAAAHGDAFRIQNRRNVVGVNVLNVKGDDSQFVVPRRIAAVKLDIGQLARTRQGVGDEFFFPGVDTIEANLLLIIDGRGKSRRAADVLRTGLKLCGKLGKRRFLLGYVVVGLTVGADVVASWTFIAEEAPSKDRAKHCGSAQIAWMLGPVVVFAASIPMNEMFGLLGNRLIFAHLIVVAAWIWYQRLKMPESAEWTAAKEREQELAAQGITERKATYADILRGTSLRTVVMCCGVYAMWNLAASTNGFFMPYVYEHVGNLSNSMGLFLTSLNFAVCILTTIIFMYTADRFNRRKIFAIFSGLGVISWLVWVLPPDMLQTWMLFFFTIVWGFSMQQQFYQLWSSELFPVRYRATAQGLTFFITRFAAAVWGFAVPIIMELLGFQTAAVLMVGFCVISWIAGTFFGADDRGKTLDEITAERYGDEVDENGWLVDPATRAGAK